MWERRGVDMVVVGKPEEGGHLVDPDVEGRIIIRRIFRTWDGVWGIDWVDLARERNRWRALVNAVMKLTVP
jgi:hypothetical protein